MPLYNGLSTVSRYREVRLILGDQLNASHSWYREQRDDVLYVLMEMRQETDYVRHHIQKVAAFFAAMRAFSEALSTKHAVLYFTLDNADNQQDLLANLRRIAQHTDATQLCYQEPDEFRLDQQLKQIDWISTSMVSSEHFLTERADLTQYFQNTNNLLMERFYRQIRAATGYLMEDNKPLGGKWNYDGENRNKLPNKVEVPPPLEFSNDISELKPLLATLETMGSLQGDHIGWPINRSQSRKLLDYFVAHLLPEFGQYQDALSTRSWSLFHSRLSFSLNTKMISPKEVVEKCLAAFNENSERISLAQIEGFIRQIIGWREYVRLIYWHHMPDYQSTNQLQHKRKLPAFYWNGETKMACMAHSIQQSLEYAYAHHIQRLMVTGNFALLAGIHPDEVDAWYLGIYIDAIEWVELPNTRGMSQFADGGILASKPYVSGGNYLQKMGHYCGDCHYDVKDKSGDNACPFNVLYWHFLDRHRATFDNNPRMGMMYRQWDKRKDEDRQAVLKRAEDYLIHLEEL
ncbi:MAG: cryptochrome/photolyase family protein [Idiomarina sp.]|nr:cryptochrome/photolyase family protein [Idiomarina sp.]